MLRELCLNLVVNFFKGSNNKISYVDAILYEEDTPIEVLKVCGTNDNMCKNIGNLCLLGEDGEVVYIFENRRQERYNIINFRDISNYETYSENEFVYKFCL